MILPQSLILTVRQEAEVHSYEPAEGEAMSRTNFLKLVEVDICGYLNFRI